MTEPEKISVSFGFSKKSEKKVLQNAIENETTQEQDTEYVTSLEDRQLKR